MASHTNKQTNVAGLAHYNQLIERERERERERESESMKGTLMNSSVLCRTHLMLVLEENYFIMTSTSSHPHPLLHGLHTPTCPFVTKRRSDPFVPLNSAFVHMSKTVKNSDLQEPFILLCEVTKRKRVSPWMCRIQNSLNERPIDHTGHGCHAL